ncbi:MAG: hypothetical protein DRP65_09465 [Planctomycetota bacterium]|nr:MAG: hypothetical protein DRP65_09465 [Planctomycetota bacterium]
MAGKADKEMLYGRYNLFQESGHGAQVIYIRTHRFCVNKPCFPDKPVKLLSALSQPFLGRSTLLSTDFQITILTDASENLDLAKSVTSILPKCLSPFPYVAGVLYSFTTSLLSIIQDFPRRSRKNCS